MDDVVAAEIDRLKKEYIEVEQISRNEKGCLLKVVNTFVKVVAMHEEFAEECKAVKKMVNTDIALPTDLIENEISRIRGKIFEGETKTGYEKSIIGQKDELRNFQLNACRTVKKIIYALLDDFYPITGELKVKADAININCREGITQVELQETTIECLNYIKELKEKISKDFKNNYSTFTMLLTHVKELEKTLTIEFGEDVRLKEIEQFEMKINSEVGSIATSFDIHGTIDEIKNNVVEKLKKIKQLVSIRKKEEIRKSRKTQKNINKLREKIDATKKDAHAMSKKARHFKKVATIDGLTGLYNRNTFDVFVKDSLKDFSEGGKPILLIFLDVDNFKWINDKFGHTAGDKVLKKVAECLEESFRKDDFIARYGGDEFAIVLEGLDEKMARKKIKEFNENFGKKRFISQNKGDIKVTVSAGISMARLEESSESLINRADKDMYKIKKRTLSQQQLQIKEKYNE